MPFPKRISPKVNVIAWLEFELIHYDDAVQQVSYFVMGFSSHFLDKLMTGSYQNSVNNYIVTYPYMNMGNLHRMFITYISK